MKAVKTAESVKINSNAWSTEISSNSSAASLSRSSWSKQFGLPTGRPKQSLFLLINTHTNETPSLQYMSWRRWLRTAQPAKKQVLDMNEDVKNTFNDLDDHAVRIPDAWEFDKWFSRWPVHMLIYSFSIKKELPFFKLRLMIGEQFLPSCLLRVS